MYPKVNFLTPMVAEMYVYIVPVSKYNRYIGNSNQQPVYLKEFSTFHVVFKGFFWEEHSIYFDSKH